MGQAAPGVTGMSFPPLCREEAAGQRGWGSEQGQDSHTSPSMSSLQLGHGCPLLAATIPSTATGSLRCAWLCTPSPPRAPATARPQGARHHESNLPRRVQSLPASVSPRSLDLLCRRGGPQHQLRAGDAHPPAITACPKTGPTVSPRCHRRRGHRERLLWPGRASLPGPGLAPAPGLMMDKPNPRSPIAGGTRKTSQAGHEASGNGWH